MVNHVSECVYKLSYQPTCTRLKISFLICLTEHLVNDNSKLLIHWVLFVDTLKSEFRYPTPQNRRVCGMRTACTYSDLLTD